MVHVYPTVDVDEPDEVPILVTLATGRRWFPGDPTAPTCAQRLY